MTDTDTVESIMALARKLYREPQGIAQQDAENNLRAAVEQIVREKQHLALQSITAFDENRELMERAERLAEQVKSLGGTPCA